MRFDWPSRILLAWMVPGLMVATTELAQANGFIINQQSVRGLGRVDAGNTVAADDPGTIFFNPAGLNALWRDRWTGDNDTLVAAGVQLIVARSQLNNAGSTAATPGTLGASVPYAGGNMSNPTDPTPIPNFYLARRLSDQVAVARTGALPRCQT